MLKLCVFETKMKLLEAQVFVANGVSSLIITRNKYNSDDIYLWFFRFLNEEGLASLSQLHLQIYWFSIDLYINLSQKGHKKWLHIPLVPVVLIFKNITSWWAWMIFGTAGEISNLFFSALLHFGVFFCELHKH